jgi:hypothetical protein
MAGKGRTKLANILCCGLWLEYCMDGLRGAEITR